MVFGLSVAVPAQVVQPGGSFPLGWFTDLFALRKALAAVTGLPVQEHGDAGHGGYGSASASAANGGHGSVQKKVKGGLDGYQPHRGDGSTRTTRGHDGYVDETSKRQASKSKAGMDQFANADGSTTQVLTAGKENYQAADGTWQPIDPTLVTSGDRWSMKANSLKVTLGAATATPVRKQGARAAMVEPSDAASATPTATATSTAPTAPSSDPVTADPSASASDPAAPATETPATETPAAGPLVSMTLPSDDSVGYDLRGASTVVPTVTDNLATYAQILPGTNLELQTFANGVKETLVLDSPDAENEWVFPLHLDGLTPRMTADGSVDLVDADGKVQASFPHGSMQDSKFNPESGDMAHSSAVTMSLTEVAGEPALKVVADRAWLDDPARVYPVRVDPTVTTGDNDDVYVDNDTSTGPSDQNGDNLPVGTWDATATTKTRSFLHFAGASTPATGQRVTSASLKLYLTWQYSCSENRPFSVYAATQSWDVNTLKSANWPGPTVSASALGSLTVADPGAACTNTASNRSVGTWVTVTLNPATFNTWTSGSPNYGLALVASETDKVAWKRFTSGTYSSGAYKPQLSLTYTPNVLPQVDTRYPTDNTVVETLTPQLATRAHDPDAYPNKGLTYTYTVYDTAANVVATSGALTSSSWQVPAGKLAWNGSYYYTVKVGDTVGTSVESNAFVFTTPVPQPRVTSDLAQNPGAGFDPNNGNYTTSASDAQVAGIGPSLEISRSYNSVDTRRTGAFGQGWSSILDVKATERSDASGAVQTVVITYPNGSEVAFGRNADGTFTAASGRYAILTQNGTTGYTLTDKDATQYVFSGAAGSKVFPIAKIIDANGRQLIFGYDGNGRVSTMTNASGRKLTMTWSTPVSGTDASHVATVATEAPTTGGTGYTWTYGYATGDQLTSVCPPGTTTACTTYTWGNTNNQHANAVLNLNPYSYWRLNDAAGVSAASSVLTNAGVDNGTYKNVTLGGAPSLTGSGASTAAFNGTSSYVQLPGKLVADGSYQSVSMWFKTTKASGVLFSYSSDAITAGTSARNYTPALYVDKNGYLRGEFWQGGIAPMKSTATVTDGTWHHAVLAGAGNTQTLYLDGKAQGTPLAGTIALYQGAGSAYEYVGAGYVGGSWPDNQNYGVSPAPAAYFNGSIADVAFYAKALTGADVDLLNSVAKTPSSTIQTITSPAGRVQAQVAVSNVTGQVTSVTDENGGLWKLGTPTVSGSSDIYAASVLGGKPTNYWRLGDTNADTTDAVNEVAGDTATYSAVTLGGTGPFADSTAATFNGTTSNIALPGTVAPAGASSAGVWFNTTSSTGGVLLGAQAGAIGDTTAPGLPWLWTTSDGRLRGLSPSATPTGPLHSATDAKCIDIAAGATADGTKAEIYDCNAAVSQNFTLPAGGTGPVKVLGKCLEVKGALAANGTVVQLATCSGGVGQVWQQSGATLKNPNSGKCLDSASGATTNHTQMQIYTCNSAVSQNWNQSLSSATAVNDGKWHSAVLTSSGTAQTLYLDGVAQSTTKGTMALDPGNQPNAYLGAGYTGTSLSGLRGLNTVRYTGKLAEAAFYPSELSADQVAAQFEASKQTVAVAVTTVDTTVKTITMPVKNVTVTDPGGKTIAYAYDLINNRQIAETDALGKITKYGYDTGGFDSLVYDPNGVRTQTVQDARGNTVQQVTCQDQSANKCSSTYYEYYLNAASPVDPRNDLMTASRDARTPADKTAANYNAYKTTYDYDAKGNPLVTTDPLGGTTSTLFTDGTTVKAFGSTTTFAPPGLPYRIVNAGGGVQQIFYTANGDVAEAISPAGEVSDYTYDNLGRKLAEKVTTSTFAQGRTTSFTYDAQSRVLTETDPTITNRVTSATHTAVTTNVYDADGNMTSQTISDSTGGDVARTQTVTFNSLGQKQSQTDALTKTTSFTYNPYGQVTSETDSDGGVTTFDVDAEGNVLSETMHGWTGDPNHPTAATDLPIVSNIYDPAGRLISRTDAVGRTTAYTYTDNGLTATVTISQGSDAYLQEKNEYDDDGNLITQWTNNGVTKTQFKYDNAGRQYQTIVDPDGVNRVTTNDLDAIGNVVNTVQNVGTGSALNATRYRYDREGRITAQTAYNASPDTTPVARWKMNQTSGTTVADSSGNNPLTATNITWTNDTTRGQVATFNGTTSTIKGDEAPVDTTQPYTLSAMVKLTSKGADSQIVALQGKLSTLPLSVSYAKTADRWHVGLAAEKTDGTIASAGGDGTSSPTLGSWTHLAVSVNPQAKTVVLYVNGTAEATLTSSQTLNAPASSILIGQPTSGTGFTGSIADVQAYQSSLSTTQVAAITSGTAPAASATVSRTSATLDESGLAVRTKDPLGNLTDVSYDEGERPTVTTGPAVTNELFGKLPTPARPVTWAGYDTFGDQTESLDANQNKSWTFYDRAGNVLETHGAKYVTPDGVTTINPMSKTDYDTLGQPTKSTDELGNETTYTYDQLGRLAKTVTPNGGETTATYDNVGEPLTVTGPTGAVSSTFYDYLGRTITSTQAVRQTGQTLITENKYNTAGLLESTKSPAGVTESYTYNNAGDQLTVKDGAGQITKTDYDGLGRPTGVEQPDGAYQSTSYDMLGRATATAAYTTRTSTPALTSSAQTYDAAGNVLTSTDGRKTVTSFTYDATGLVLGEHQPTTVADTQGTAVDTSFGYDLLGNRTRFTDGRKNAFWTTYNTWNLPEKTIEPATSQYPAETDRSYTTTYDAAGQTVKRTSPGGIAQTYTYDNMGELTSQSGTGAEAATSARTFGYDLGGRVTKFSSPTGDNTVDYDDRGLPTAVTGPSGNSSFTYTDDGLMSSRADAAGTTNYAYDQADRLFTLKNTTAGTDLTYTYDQTSAVSQITYGGTANRRIFTYDGLHRTTADELKTSGGTSLAKIAYGWDENSNETSKTTTNFGSTTATTTNTYTYDRADRLTSWGDGNTTIGYTYDLSGNRTGNGSTTYTYDERNRLTTDNTGVSYGYTPRGTLKNVVGPNNAYTTTADAFDQTITQTYNGGTETYGYDALGRALQTGFSYTGTSNDLAKDDSGATYVRDPGSDLVGAASAGNTRLVWTDLHDDVVGQFTTAGTTLAGKTIYDPLGTVKTSTGMVGNLGYQSEYTETTTGRVNMAARWYNTGTGQFDNRDTVANNPAPDSIDANRYQYASANPMMNTDPTGHMSLGGLFNKAKSVASSAYHAVGSYTAQAYSAAYSYGSYAYHSAAATYYSAKAKVYSAVATVARHTGMKGLAKKAEQGRKRATQKKRAQQHRAYKAHQEAKRKGAALKQRAARAVVKAVKIVGDAAKKSVKYVKEHKKQIIAVVAVVATVALAFTPLGPVGAMAAGIAINMLKDAASGDIHNLSDLGNSFASAAISGAIGLATGGLGGAIGGKVAGYAAGKLGANLFGKAISGGIAGGVGGGVADAAEQVATTGHVNWSQTAQAASTGALVGAVVGGRSGGNRSCPKSDNHSFAPSTQVLMADGSKKKIGDVKLGDQVVATDPKSGKTENKSVSVLHHHQDTDLVDITVQDGKTAKAAVVHTTVKHPFWNATDSKWDEAQDLKVGDELRDADGVSTQTVAAVTIWTGLNWMDDLTVNDLHTYYVLVGNEPVLVHNCGGSVTGHSGTCGCGTGGQVRWGNGTFGKSNGGGQVGEDDEINAWDHLELDGANVVRKETQVRSPAFKKTRKYDGLVEIEGQWLGIETKGATGKRNPHQQAFDDWLNEPGNTVTTKDGKTIVGTFDVWIDRK
ncbi:LamG-like jellyroll fold domain-containing protein [Actinoplanes sp. L3-i22]|uniref:LamG-like jellyroll fold domain-containing protein n=1 Tax=Actinoplanes sp. L3-i22 TaxID=2836373 RepID=UPI001C73F48D|nr:LamG-like jellyroll fold domain-containing protein [Actinoplanes sp. L3-i22]BCY11084.1 hypothetical protein L3i22_061720 [Actinoplanes sp. L3-i22]